MRKLISAIVALTLAASTATAQIITGSVPNTFVNGTIIDATQVNADYTYIISQVNANGAKNSVNNDIIALSALTTPLTPAQSGSNIYFAGTSSGPANAQVVSSAVPANFTLATGKTIRFIAGATNTGATTLAVNGLAATNVYRQTPAGIVPLIGGEIAAGALIEAYYDGTQFQLLTNITENGGFGQLTNFAGSATPDLGLVPSHNINLTGGPFTITSFGSSANAAYPIYLVRFNAANILTQSASLNMLAGVSRLTAASDQGLYFYNGSGIWFELAYFPATTKYAPTGASNLVVKNNTVTPNTIVDVTATEVVMDSASGGNHYTDNYGTCSINFGVVGAGGLDAGAIAANTWYYFYAIGTGIATSCLASTSSTSPTLPSGYPYKVRVGANRTSSAAGTLWPIYQHGAEAQFYAAPAVAADQQIGITSGGGLTWGTCSATTQTLATRAVWGTGVPSTAAAIDVVATTTNGGQLCVAPYTGTSANPPVGITCATAGASQVDGATARLNYIGATGIGSCASDHPGNIGVRGWVDHVNAN